MGTYGYAAPEYIATGDNIFTSIYVYPTGQTRSDLLCAGFFPRPVPIPAKIVIFSGMDNPWGGGMVFILFPNFFQEDFVLCLHTRRDKFSHQ
jgi:hypothetical protein